MSHQQEGNSPRPIKPQHKALMKPCICEETEVSASATPPRHISLQSHSVHSCRRSLSPARVLSHTVTVTASFLLVSGPGTLVRCGARKPLPITRPTFRLTRSAGTKMRIPHLTAVRQAAGRERRTHAGRRGSGRRGRRGPRRALTCAGPRGAAAAIGLWRRSGAGLGKGGAVPRVASRASDPSPCGRRGPRHRQAFWVRLLAPDTAIGARTD